MFDTRLYHSRNVSDLLQAISQIGHCTDGTQRLLEPVSNITLKVCGGVPISIGP